MELQWPLIIFTTLVAWSAGLFASQCAFALKGVGKKAQMPAWIVSAVLLVTGGIAVFFHLQHWERIFNGFGHLTSGITQELIAIVVLGIVAVVYLVLLRKSDDGGSVPAWIAVVGIVVSAVLVAVMAHSYMMAARPAWDSVFWIPYVLGNACVLGPATFALLPGAASADEDAALPASVGLFALIGAVVNAVTTAAYAIALQMSGSAFADVGRSFMMMHPMKPAVDVTAATNVFAGEFAPVMWVGVLLVGAVLPLAATFLASRKGRGRSSVSLWMAVAVAAALVGAVCMRVVFYSAGASVFMF